MKIEIMHEKYRDMTLSLNMTVIKDDNDYVPPTKKHRQASFYEDNQYMTSNSSNNFTL